MRQDGSEMNTESHPPSRETSQLSRRRRRRDLSDIYSDNMDMGKVESPLILTENLESPYVTRANRPQTVYWIC